MDNKTNERIVPIMEAIIEDTILKSLLLMFQIKILLNSLPENIVVEVPGILNKSGVTGVKLRKLSI